jgi:hypothetical protein
VAVPSGLTNDRKLFDELEPQIEELDKVVIQEAEKRMPGSPTSPVVEATPSRS